MKRIIFVVGVVVLIIGLVLYLSPTALSTLANDSGISGSVVNSNKALLLNVNPGNYTTELVTLSHNNNLNVSYDSEPAGIEFLLMNQGNYTLFASGSPSNVQVYSESKLNQSGDSFSFTPSSTSTQNYYLVFRSLPGRNVSTNLVLNLEVVAQVSAFDTLFIPYALFAFALILLVFGIFGGRRRNITAASASLAQRGESGARAVQPISQAKCKFCNAPMPSGMVFCPSCGKSQS